MFVHLSPRIVWKATFCFLSRKKSSFILTRLLCCWELPKSASRCWEPIINYFSLLKELKDKGASFWCYSSSISEGAFCVPSFVRQAMCRSRRCCPSIYDCIRLQSWRNVVVDSIFAKKINKSMFLSCQIYFFWCMLYRYVIRKKGDGKGFEYAKIN